MASSSLLSPSALEVDRTTLEDRLRQRTARVVVLGLGNAGLPIAVEVAGAGYPLTGYDVDSNKVDAINAGRSPIAHVSHEHILRLRHARTLSATTNSNALADADVAIVCVPTPLGDHGAPDLQFVLAASRVIGRHLRRGMLVVVQSTCPPGATTRVQAVLEQISGLRAESDFFLAYAPERIDPANERFSVRNTPKLVGGIGETSTRVACQLFESCVDDVVPVSSPLVAEMAKLVENTFRFVNISFANELALLCDRLGVNVNEVIDAAASKPFAFMAHRPSAGIGGDCIPVVPFFLDSASRHVGLDLQLVRASARIDEAMPGHIVDRLEQSLPLAGARVFAIGVTYKPDVAGLSNSAAVRVLHEVKARGARVVYHDPLACSLELDDEALASVPLTDDEIASADAVLLLTVHRSIDVERITRKARLVVDTRSGLTPAASNVVNVWAPAVKAPVPSNVIAKTRPKFLLYSHDTYGLGNIRRTLLLAEELRGQYPDSAILIVTGSPMIHAFRIPEGVDYIKLPCLDRVAAERYEPRFLSSWTDEVKRIRGALIEQAVLGFEPDLMIVDKRPGGVDGELLPSLNRLRSTHHRPRLVLGIRDILDTPERTRRSFANSQTFETILEHYDEVWIYGEKSIFDAVEAYGFPDAVGRLTHYCGYLKRSLHVPPRVDATPHVLVTTGGGGDGSRMIETYLEGLAALPPQERPRTTVVLGPEMPAPSRESLLQRFRHLEDRVTFLDFEPDLPLLLAQSDVVVAMAGYNTVCELLLFGRRAVLVPRAEPVREQLIRARLFAARGYFDMVEPDALTPDALMSRVLANLESPASRASTTVDLDALPRIRERVRALLGARVDS